MNVSIFYSWQSDTAPVRGRDLIGRALVRAADSIAADDSMLYRPTVDRDTRGVPGAPSMVAAILKKIDACSIFVADVSLTFGRSEGERQSPNPNVLIELGYALKRLGPERLLLVLDAAMGGPEQLPFDLRGNRVIVYGATSADDAALESELAAPLEESIGLILRTVGPPSDVAPVVHLDLQFTKERIESAQHDYRLHVKVVNSGTTVLKDWAVDLRFPGALLNPNRSYPIVQMPSDDARVTMRQTESSHSGPIFPGDRPEVIAVDYMMTHALYDRRGILFPQLVEAFLYVEGNLVASSSRTVKDLQFF